MEPITNPASEQDKSHTIETAPAVRHFEMIRVWSRTREHAERFAAEVGAEVMTAEVAVRDCGVQARSHVEATAVDDRQRLVGLGTKEHDEGLWVGRPSAALPE
jgi:hypothetical protein